MLKMRRVTKEAWGFHQYEVRPHILKRASQGLKLSDVICQSIFLPVHFDSSFYPSLHSPLHSSTHSPSSPLQMSPSLVMACLHMSQLLAFLKGFSLKVCVWTPSSSSGCRQTVRQRESDFYSVHFLPCYFFVYYFVILRCFNILLAG